MKEIIDVPKGTDFEHLIKIILDVRKRSEACWIYIDPKLLKREKLKEDGPFTGICSIIKNGYKLKIDKGTSSQYWLIWYAFKDKNICPAYPEYLITALGEEDTFYLKEQS